MAGLSAELGDNEFVGYIFQGSPERRPRLWFLDRHIEQLFLWDCAAHNGRVAAEIHEELGIWTLEPVEGLVYNRGLLRYQHMGDERWSAVWRLTDVTIPRDPDTAKSGLGITTFGYDDDVWRLGLWPD